MTMSRVVFAVTVLVAILPPGIAQADKKGGDSGEAAKSPAVPLPPPDRDGATWTSQVENAQAQYEALVERLGEEQTVWDGLPTVAMFFAEKQESAKEQWADFKLPLAGSSPLAESKVVVQGDAISFDILSRGGVHAVYGRVPAALHDTLTLAGFGTVNDAAGSYSPRKVRLLVRLDYIREMMSNAGIRISVPQLRIMAVWAEDLLWTSAETKGVKKVKTPGKVAPKK